MAQFGDKVHVFTNKGVRRGVMVNCHNNRTGEPLDRPWVVWEDKPSFPEPVSWDELKPEWPKTVRQATGRNVVVPARSVQ
jgi:hypothetical protein